MGEKGQVVIPAEARKAMNLKKGERLLVFGMGKEMFAFTKFSQLQTFTKHLTAKLGELQEIIKENDK